MLNGTIGDDVDYDARKSNQCTGFILEGALTAPAFTASGSEDWNDPTFGEWDFGAYTFSVYTFDNVVEW